MTDTLPSKFLALEAALNQEVLERRVEVWGHLLALVGGTTCFTIGPPGIAKTMLPLRLAKYVTGGEFFDLAVNSFTQPEEFFGPQSITALKKDRFERMIEGTLATANWGVIDEIFKAYKVLTSLHRIINEGTFKNGTRTDKVPLTTLFCMSNELPRVDELEAIYDRLLLRFSVKPIQDPKNLKRVLAAEPPEDPTPLLSWAEVEVAQKEARSVILPEEVLDGAVSIWRELKAVQVTPSDRRLARSMRLVRAAAWLDGCDTADKEHLRVLEHVLWHHPDQQNTVAQIVNAVANPLDNEILELHATLEELEQALAGARALDPTNIDGRVKAGNELDSKLQRTAEEYHKLKTRAGKNEGRRARLDEIRTRTAAMVEILCVEFFDFKPDTAAALSEATVERR